MSSKKISHWYFPVALRFASPVVAGGGVYLIIIGHPVWGSLLILLALIMMTTRYVTQIDPSSKTYDDYLFFLGLPLNREKNSFRQMDRIIITKGNYSQTINTRAQSRQLDWSDYTATLLFDHGTLDLITMNDKHKLVVYLKELSRFLEVEVEDRTMRDPYIIDMERVE